MWSIDHQFALGLESIVMPTTLHRKSVIEPDSPQYVHCVLDQFVCSILRFVWCALQCIVAMVLVMPQLLFVLFPLILSFFIHSKPTWNQSTKAVHFFSFSVILAFWNATPPHAEHLIMPSIREKKWNKMKKRMWNCLRCVHERFVR